MSRRHHRCKTRDNSMLIAIILLLLLNDISSDNSTNNTTDSSTGNTTGNIMGDEIGNTIGNTTGNITTGGIGNPLRYTSSSSNKSYFTESVYHSITGNTINYSPPFNTAFLSTVTVFVENIGPYNCLKACLEISPDDVYFITDSKSYDIMPGEVRAFVPSIYSKFARIAFKSAICNCTTNIKIVFQGKI